MAELALLRPHLLAAKGPLFAVLDGAQFDDLPAALFDGDFVHRPLYLDRGNIDRDRVRTTPQLVWLDRDADTPSPDRDILGAVIPDVLDRLLALVGDRHAVVFWECPNGGDVLYRHLRTINMVMFPRDANFDPGKSYETDPTKEASNVGDTSIGTQPSHELVLFRHADANVVAQVVPALNRPQLARFFGPATQLLVLPEEEWGDGRPMRARRRQNLPNAPVGPLRLDKRTVEAIERRRLIALRQRRLEYLRDTCKGETEGASEETLAGHILISEKTGKQLGLVSEAAHCRWAFIMCKTNGRVMQVPEVHRRIAREGRSPDDQVKRLMAEIATTLKQANTKVQG